jgi:hypothetical protein
MKTTALVAVYAAIVGASTQKDGYMYTIDQNVHSAATQYIDADLANSIIARRRGLTDSRYLSIADASIIDDLNTFGGWQQPLFDGGKTSAPGKLFIRISGFDGSFTDLGDQLPDLLIEQPTTNLRDDFKAATSRRERLCEYSVPPSVNSPQSNDVEVVFTYPQEDVCCLTLKSNPPLTIAQEPSCLPASDIPHIPVILSLHSVLPTSASAGSLSKTLGPLTRILRHLSATQNVESTILILPSKLAKSKSSHTHKHHARSNPEETPLDLPYPTLSPATLADSNSTTNTTHPLPSAIPECFTSMDTCVNTTNACSGHGKCYEARNRCFKCKCHATLLRTNDDGSKKTIEWGGGACEKKDVSVPFVLFSFFAIFMLTVVFGAVGMLYSMGSEDLPKVLSAGVGGGRAGQK